MSTQDQEAGGAAPAPATSTDTSRQQHAPDDNLVCQWEKCSERCDSPEALYVSILLTFGKNQLQY
jgi:hypothetical protein